MSENCVWQNLYRLLSVDRNRTLLKKHLFCIKDTLTFQSIFLMGYGAMICLVKP